MYKCILGVLGSTMSTLDGPDPTTDKTATNNPNEDNKKKDGNNAAVGILVTLLVLALIAGLAVFIAVKKNICEIYVNLGEFKMRKNNKGKLKRKETSVNMKGEFIEGKNVSNVFFNIFGNYI